MQCKKSVKLMLFINLAFFFLYEAQEKRRDFLLTAYNFFTFRKKQFIDIKLWVIYLIKSPN